MADDILVVGAAAGGVKALRALVGGLPPEFPTPVVVVLRVARSAPSPNVPAPRFAAGSGTPGHPESLAGR
jgi:two-component system chemotaxis response regulator CheB